MSTSSKSAKNYELAKLRLWAFDSARLFLMQIKNSDGSIHIRPMTINEAKTQADELLVWALKS